MKAKCFYRCDQLTNITLPSSLKEIGDSAFGETKITTITIPESVTQMGNDCFEGCDQLTEVICPDALKDFIRSSLNGTTTIITQARLKEISGQVSPSEKITSISIPDGSTK